MADLVHTTRPAAAPAFAALANRIVDALGDRDRIEDLVEHLVELLNAIDGDPEMEDDGDGVCFPTVGAGDAEDAEDDDPAEEDDPAEDDGDFEPDQYAAPIYPTMPERSQDPSDWPGRWFGRQADVCVGRERQPVGGPPWRGDPVVIEFPRIPAR
jgi:hypothetical protein